MAQNACLARERNDGAVEYAYLHYGSLDDAGPILLQHYNTPERAAALLALGDLSAVGVQLTPPSLQPSPTGDNPEQRQQFTIAYHRDRGDSREQTTLRLIASVDQLVKRLNARARNGQLPLPADQVYLRRPDGWHLYCRRMAAPRPLAQLLGRQGAAELAAP